MRLVRQFLFVYIVIYNTILTCDQNGVSSFTARFLGDNDERIYLYQYVRVCVSVRARVPGLVPEPSFQREAHEAAERTGRPETRVFPEPEADEDAGGPARARRAHPKWPILLLWR